VTCPNCGRYAPADAETGYDADELCPDCAACEADCASDDDWDDRREEQEIDR